ncbi:hypothetical protein CMI40_01140 [Candidatus Pacearchaeota archaeon]|jgi:hypothetical protein|nr:hypothetical protein [Candidatus Pacearchaeota archaeon]|tara:strand:+ start:1548 stop:1847 length:300 start_codon:yes stop_codon:yes gene_type:complete
MIREIKIVRREYSEIPMDLKNRTYECLKQSKLDQGEWNSYGRRYSIRGLHNLNRTPGIKLLPEDGIEKDLREYEELQKNSSLERKGLLRQVLNKTNLNN